MALKKRRAAEKSLSVLVSGARSDRCLIGLPNLKEAGQNMLTREAGHLPPQRRARAHQGVPLAGGSVSLRDAPAITWRSIALSEDARLAECSPF